MKSMGQLLLFGIERKRRKAVLARQTKAWWSDQLDWEVEDVDQFCDRLVLLVAVLAIALLGSWVWFLS